MLEEHLSSAAVRNMAAIGRAVTKQMRRSGDELLVDGFVLRYDTHTSDDGLPGGKGAFLACSFWLAKPAEQ